MTLVGPKGHQFRRTNPGTGALAACIMRAGNKPRALSAFATGGNRICYRCPFGRCPFGPSRPLSHLVPIFPLTVDPLVCLLNITLAGGGCGAEPERLAAVHIRAERGLHWCGGTLRGVRVPRLPPICLFARDFKLEVEKAKSRRETSWRHSVGAELWPRGSG